MSLLIDDQEVSRARHDLRTVVNHLQGYVILLREEQDLWLRELEIVESLDRIEEAGREVLQVLDRPENKRRTQPPAQTLAQIQAHLESPALAVEAALLVLRKVESAAEHRDVARLGLAAERLRQFITTGEVHASDRPTGRDPEATGARANPRIVVIEDDDGNRELLHRMLARFHYDASCAVTGAEAMRRLGAQTFDVILLDLMLPDIDGYTLLERLRRQAPLIPVIVISALNEVEKIVSCIEAGSEDYFIKPFIPALLRTRVASAIDRKRYRELLAQAGIHTPR
jgi:CheY-like chemotaxis protein